MEFSPTNINNLEILVENQTLTTDGSTAVRIDTSQYKEFYFVVRINGPVTGTTPTIQFALSDLDLFGIAVTSNVTYSNTYTTTTLSQLFKHTTQTGIMQLSWVITGSTPSFDGVYVGITGIKDSFITGQTTMAESMPVTIATDQSSITIDAVSLPLPTGAATSDNQTNNQQTSQLVNSLGNAVAVKTLGSTPLAADYGLETNSLMYGLTTGGGGGYVPVKVNPSGTMEVNASQNGTWTIIANAGTGTFTTQDTSSLVDNSPFTDNSSRVLPAGYVFDDTVGIALTENDIAAARVDSKRAQILVIEDATTRGQKAAVSSAGALSENLTQIGGSSYTLGQKTSANSAPIVIASDQSTINTNTSITSVASTVAPSLSNKLKIEPTFTTIAIPSSVSYTTIYTYTGSGYFLGFNMEFNNTAIVVKVVIDGNTMMDGTDIGQYNTLAATSGSSAKYQQGIGVITAASVIDFSTRYPIAYTSSIVISARLTSGATSRNFNQGIFNIQKDT